MCKSFVDEMEKEFKMSMFGKIKFFVGLQVYLINKGIYITHSKYVMEIMKIFEMEYSRPVRTPMVTGHKLSKNDALAKVIINSIRGANGKIEDETIIRKVLRTLLPIYAIRVSTIQELRCTLGNALTLEGVIGRLTTFEMSNFDNYTPTTIEYAFKSQLVLSKKEKENM